MKLPRPRSLIVGVVIALIVIGMGLVIAQDQETLRYIRAREKVWSLFGEVF